MNSDDEDLLIAGTIEDADAPALREPTRRSPEEVVLKLFSARWLEAEDLAALRIDAGHDVLDGPILPGRVH